MNDAFVVRGRERVGDLPADRESFLNRKAVAFDEIRKRRPFDEFQHERGSGSGVFNTVDAAQCADD